MTHANSCAALASDLSPYLDGELSTERRCELLRHLQSCDHCAARLRQLRAVSAELRQLPAPAPPRYLALRLRVRASHYAARHEQIEFWQMRLQNWARALAVPVVAGVLGAVCVFALFFGPMGHTALAAAAVADVPLPLSAPPRLVNLAPVEVNRPLLIEADIDSLGRVDGYRVLAGPHDPALIERLNNALLMTVFRPATILGEATPGQVLLSFDTVTVHVRG